MSSPDLRPDLAFPLSMLSTEVGPDASVSLHTTPDVPCIVHRLVIARESAFDRCVEHEDCRASSDLGLACLMARLPLNVSIVPGFDVISVRCGLTEYLPGGYGIPASGFLQDVQTHVPFDFIAYPGMEIMLTVRNRAARDRTFMGYWECVRGPEPRPTEYELARAFESYRR